MGHIPYMSFLYLNTNTVSIMNRLLLNTPIITVLKLHNFELLTVVRCGQMKENTSFLRLNRTFKSKETVSTLTFTCVCLKKLGSVFSSTWILKSKLDSWPSQQSNLDLIENVITHVEPFTQWGGSFKDSILLLYLQPHQNFTEADQQLFSWPKATAQSTNKRRCNNFGPDHSFLIFTSCYNISRRYFYTFILLHALASSIVFTFILFIFLFKVAHLMTLPAVLNVMKSFEVKVFLLLGNWPSPSS